MKDFRQPWVFTYPQTYPRTEVIGLVGPTYGIAIHPESQVKSCRVGGFELHEGQPLVFLGGIDGAGLRSVDRITLGSGDLWLVVAETLAEVAHLPRTQGRVVEKSLVSDNFQLAPANPTVSRLGVLIDVPKGYCRGNVHGRLPAWFLPEGESTAIALTVSFFHKALIGHVTFLEGLVFDTQDVVLSADLAENAVFSYQFDIPPGTVSMLATVVCTGISDVPDLTPRTVRVYAAAASY